MYNDNVAVGKMVLENDLFYRGRVILSYKIEYPQFHSEKYAKSVVQINKYYRSRALALENYYKNSLYYDAVEQAGNSEDPRDIRYEALVIFEVTYNRNCAVSLYIDKYEYTGGAHGMTIRYSDTWNIQIARKMQLCEFFAPGVDYRAYTVQSVNEQIQMQIDQGNDIFFENYSELIITNFSKEDFYLVKGGVTVYYQLYELAPYVAGILTFIIPFEYGCLMPAKVQIKLSPGAEKCLVKADGNSYYRNQAKGGQREDHTRLKKQRKHPSYSVICPLALCHRRKH